MRYLGLVEIYNCNQKTIIDIGNYHIIFSKDFDTDNIIIISIQLKYMYDDNVIFDSDIRISYGNTPKKKYINYETIEVKYSPYNLTIPEFKDQFVHSSTDLINDELNIDYIYRRYLEEALKIFIDKFVI